MKTNHTEEAFHSRLFVRVHEMMEIQQEVTFFIESVNGKAFVNFSAFLGILVMLICSAEFQEKQARAGCCISSKQQVIRFDRPLPKQICQSELLRFASQVAKDQTSNAAWRMSHVSDPKLSPEYLLHQPDDPTSLIWFHNQEEVQQ